MSDPEPQKVFAVVFGNYEPREVDSIWSTEELAQACADRFSSGRTGCSWSVETWEVQTENNIA